MELEFTKDDGVLAIVVSGRIGQFDVLSDVDLLTAEYGPDVYQHDAVMDLSHCDYINSSGVSWLLGCNKRFHEAGRRLVLHSIRPTVWQVLRLLRMEKVLETAHDSAAARDLLSRPSEL